MLLSTLLLGSGLMIGQVTPVPFTRVFVNSNNTATLHVWVETSPMAVKANGTSIPLYPNTTGVSDVDAEIDDNGDFVVAWRASITYNGTNYVTACVSVNGGTPVFVSNSSGAPDGVLAGPRVTTSPTPSGSTMPITVAWQKGGSGGVNQPIRAQTFTGTPATDSIAKLSDATDAHPNYMYVNQYNMGDVSAGDGGNFVVTYTRIGGFGVPTGVIAHGGTYGSNISTERFAEIAMAEGNGASMQYSQSEVACYHDTSFVVLYNDGKNKLNSESFYANGTRVASSTRHHGSILGTGFWNNATLIMGDDVGNYPNARSLSLAVQRDSGGDYIVAWCSQHTATPAMTNYLANMVVQKVKGLVLQTEEFRTTFTDDSPPTFSRAVTPSISLTDSDSDLYYLDYIVNDYIGSGMTWVIGTSSSVHEHAVGF
jgi:hypothetical protein